MKKPHLTNDFSYICFSRHLCKKLLWLLLFFIWFRPQITDKVIAQEIPQSAIPDTIIQVRDTTGVFVNQNDTTDLKQTEPGKKKFALEAKVVYKAADSLYFDLEARKAYLFYNAEIEYENIHLKAHYFEIDFVNNTLFASGLPDSLGVIQGIPEFIEGQQSFIANTMNYNFETKQGFIREVISQEGDGFLHGNTVKKMENDITNVSKGSYTTCNLNHPHFEFRYQKAKVIPNDKIVTGPVYLVIEDVPLPLAIPFGFFPNKKGQKSGILIPTYGESNNRGFYFENGGYYFGLSDYAELYIRGDIYTRGSWAVKPNLNYRKRYKYNGSLNLNFANNITGEEGSPEYQKNKDFAVRWTHSQDPKAHPTQRFTANVNVQSSKYNRFNPVTTQNYLSNTFQSSISYQRSFAGKYFLNASATHSQNTLNKSVTMTLPDVSFNVNRFYPFRKKDRVGSLRWYEDISVNYTMNSRNQVTTTDSLLFRRETLDNFKNGVKHSVPVSSNLKVLKYFNLTNSVNYNERWYFQRHERQWVDNTVNETGDVIPGYVKTDTVRGFFTVRDFDFRTALNTTLYGLVQFKKGPLRAVRHVMNPSVGFGFRPDFATDRWKYYGQVQVDSTGKTQRYSYYQNFIWGTAPEGKSGSLNLGISNNLEIKVRSKSDTITGMKKVKLLDNLSISGSYDIARDSLKWSAVNVSGYTTLFKNLQVRYSGSWSPYAIDSIGRLINKFVWETDRKILRRENMAWNFSMRYSLSANDVGKKQKSRQSPPPSEAREMIGEHDMMLYDMDDFIDWNQPWNFSFDYSLALTNRYSAARQKYENQTIQTLSFNGDLNLTPKWKIGFRSGYDFESKKLTYTSFNFYRDLHCWEMRFNWIPTGGMKSWNFQINVKSAMLQDLKLTQKKDFRDY